MALDGRRNGSLPQSRSSESSGWYRPRRGRCHPGATTLAASAADACLARTSSYRSVLFVIPAKGGFGLTTVDLPGEVFIRRARSARARKRLARPGTAEWLEAETAERDAVAGLKREFGVVDDQTV